MPGEIFGEDKRVLAIDLGEKRVGLAISDPTGHFAVGLETLYLSVKTHIWPELNEIFTRYPIALVVLGLPMNMNGSEGPQARIVRAFGEDLAERFKIPVSYLDERLTSVLAHQTLREQGIKPSRNKGLIDQAAAKRILQDYLDRSAIARKRAFD